MPPPSWYAPYLGAKDFKKEMSKHIDSQLKAPGMGGTAGSAIGETQRHYEDGFGWAGSPGYMDDNVENDEPKDEEKNKPKKPKKDDADWWKRGEAPPF